VKFLLDSHALLWALFEPERLSPNARALIGNAENQVVVSYANFWEITVKIAKGKLTVPGSSEKPILAESHDLGFQFLAFHDDHLVVLESLPKLSDHKDPFGRMLVAQAIVEGLPLLTVDAKMKRYPVQTIWK
jgi:PIN domain nuclease of toxin-antitoxin system